VSKATGAIEKQYSLLSPEELQTIADKKFTAIAPNKLARIVSDTMKELSGIGQDIKIYPTFNAIPEAMRDGLHPNANAFIIPGRDRPPVAPIGDRIRNARDARRTIEREIIGHVAVEHLLGDQISLLHAKVRRAIAKDPAVADIFEAVRSEYPLFDEKTGRGFTLAQQYNEVIARIAEPETKLFRGVGDVLYGVRDALASRGFKSILGLRQAFGQRTASNSELQDLKRLLSQVSYSYRRGSKLKPRDVTQYTAKGYRAFGQRIMGNDERYVIEPTRTLENEKRWFDRYVYMYAFYRASRSSSVIKMQPKPPALPKRRSVCCRPRNQSSWRASSLNLSNRSKTRWPTSPSVPGAPTMKSACSLISTCRPSMPRRSTTTTGSRGRR
jgi:hypothetical protein